MDKFDWESLPNFGTRTSPRIREDQLQEELKKAQAHIRYLEEKILSLELDLEKANAN